MSQAADATVCVLAFDVGERWVGVAIGNSLSQQARPLKVLKRDQPSFWSELDRLIQEWRPDRIVVGDPLTHDGGLQPATLVARKFARQLHGRSRLPVTMTDERLSSRDANQQFAAQRRHGLARKRDGQLQDAYAASVILQRWLDAGMPLTPLPAIDHEHNDSPPTDA